MFHRREISVKQLVYEYSEVQKITKHLILHNTTEQSFRCTLIWVNNQYLSFFTMNVEAIFYHSHDSSFKLNLHSITCQTWHFIIYTAHAVWSSLDHYSQLVMSSAYKRLAEVSRHIRPLLISTLLPSMRFVASLYLFSYMASNNWAEHTSILVCLCVDVALCHFRIWVRRYCIFALPLLKFIVRFCCLM